MEKCDSNWITFGANYSILTFHCLFYICALSLALAGRLGLDHITESRWTRELQQRGEEEKK